MPTVYINKDEIEALRKARNESKALLDGSASPEYHDKHGDVPKHLNNLLDKIQQANQ